MRAHVLMLSLALATGPAVAASSIDPCPDLPSCLARLAELAAVDEPDGGMSGDEAALARRLAGMPEAVPELAARLVGPDPAIAEQASMALARAPYIPTEFLPQLRVGLERGLGWLPPALAAVPGEEAAALAVEHYLADPGSPQNQHGYALRKLGARAIAPLLAAARCGANCDVRRSWLIGQALAENPDGPDAAPDLVALAGDPTVTLSEAAHALQSLEGLGPRARHVAPALLALAQSRPVLATAVEDAAFALRLPEAAPMVARTLGHSPSSRLLQDLAEFGADGGAAVPAVLALLDASYAGPTGMFDDADDLRVAAARTLGAIGDEHVVPVLRAALADERDLRVVRAAAESLGRLRAVSARDAVETVARSHYHPLVRAGAAAALARLDAVDTDVSDVADRDGQDAVAGSLNPFEIYTGLPGYLGGCDPLPPARRPRRRELRADRPEHAASLARLSYDAIVLSYGADDADEQRAEALARGEETPIIRVDAGNLLEHRTPVRQVPVAALRVQDGWLVGGSRGEWGGELMFLPTQGEPRQLYDGNVEDIHRLGERIVVTTGLAHLFVSKGRVLEVVREGEDWRATVWRVLPGAPVRSWSLRDGRLLIDTAGGGSVILDADGRFTMACELAPQHS